MLEKLLQNGLQDWIDDLNMVIHWRCSEPKTEYKNQCWATEILGAILKTCQDYNLNKEDIYKFFDNIGLKIVIRGIVKIQYSKNYKKIKI